MPPPLSIIQWKARITVILDRVKGQANPPMSVRQAKAKLTTIVRRLTSHIYRVSALGPLGKFSTLQAALDYGVGLPTHVDHAVPVAAIVQDMLWTARKGPSESAWLCIENCFVLVRVTPSEHLTLSHSCMPASWRDDADDAWFARYEAAGIDVPLREVDDGFGNVTFEPR
jgi:hypothetical protein